MSLYSRDEEDWNCEICGEQAIESFFDEEWDDIECCEVEVCVRSVCNSCGYVFEGAADPWELDQNEKIEKQYKKQP